MTIEAIAATSSAAVQIIEPKLQSVVVSEFSQTTKEIGVRTDFSTLIANGLNQVNQQLISNQTGLQELAVGNVQNLHQIMIGLEESRLTFQLAMQVRNRALEAYQDVMKMQI